MQFDFRRFQEQFGVDPKEHFKEELQELENFASDGILSIDDQGVRISEQGRLIVRNVAMVFDQYLSDENRKRYSRTI